MLDWLQSDPWGFLQFMLYRAPAVLLAITMHELAHGFAALKSGDTTARDMGRLSLNPLRHLDLLGTISLFLLGVGWAKPVPVNPNRFRNRRWNDLLVSLAGVATNFALFLLGTLLAVLVGRFLYHSEALSFFGPSFFLSFQEKGFIMQLYPEFAEALSPMIKSPALLHVQRFLFQLAMINLGMGLFNLLPIPPLDGFHVVNDIIFKGKLNIAGKAFRIAQLALIILLLTTNFIGNWITQAIYAVQGFIFPLFLAIFPL
ncbi:MAG: site-2 protease family protein [Eubacteriales bacterium]|nr:site-2 protease family protein [Eubacteriales bacterium]